MTRASDQFIARQYNLKPVAETGLLELTVFGERTGRPSKRLSLKQSGLKIVSATIRSESRNKIFDYDLARINHLPTFGEVRLHTKNLMYPGKYQIQLVFRGKSFDEIKDYLKSEQKEPAVLYWPIIGSNADTQIKIS